MKRYFAIAGGAALALGLAFAQTQAASTANQGLGGGLLRAAIRQRVLKNLALTDAQKAQAKTILQQANQTAQPIRQLVRQNRQALAAAIKANNTAQIQQLATAGGNLQGQLLAIRAAAKASFYAVLTPDQQTKLETMAQNLKNVIAKRVANRLAP